MGRHEKRACPICNGTGVVTVWKREPLTGQKFPYTEICPCQGG